ncbi:MAG: hypothetical protein MJ252_06240 [archaeon]|nr:hypothetical protein [archaeon]
MSSEPSHKEPSEIYSLLKDGIKDTYLHRLNLGPNSVYCFECKRAFESPKDHPQHPTYTRKDYYNYMEKLFTPTESIINQLLNTLNTKKSEAVSSTLKAIEDLEKSLEELKSTKVEEINSNFGTLEENVNELKNYFQSAKEAFQNYYSETEKFYKMYEGNEDKENTIFLMHFDLAENYKNQNEKITKELTKTENSLANFSTRVDAEIKLSFDQINHILSLNVPLEKFEDFYWDCNNQTNKYLDHMDQFKKTVKEIYDIYGNLGQIREALTLFDAKTKRGVDYLFNQDFFVEGGGDAPKLKRTNTNPKLKAVKSSNNIQNKTEGDQNELKELSKPYPGDFRGHPSNKRLRSANKTLSPQKSSKNTLVHSNSNATSNISGPDKFLDVKNINLSSPILQRFFAYSFLNYYNKNFCPVPERESIKTSEHLLLDYARKQRVMKEYTKPIPGTNKISIYNPKTKKLIQAEVGLNQEDHGYNAFPDGCRSIFIDGKLYITGGKDKIGNTLSIVNMIDLKEGLIYPKPQMKTPHAYHSIEYLENYECLIVVGGKGENYYAEIYDIYANKWQMLPNLNQCRYNTNIVYNSFAGEIYVLFGMLDNGRNTDSIELLELKDIKGGWIKIDYAKTALFDLQVNLCKVVQFNSEKLLIYGANDYRNEKKKFGLYLLDKNEIVKVEDENDKAEIALFERDGRTEDSGSSGHTPLNTIQKTKSSKRSSKSGNKFKSTPQSSVKDSRHGYMGYNNIFK